MSRHCRNYCVVGGAVGVGLSVGVTRYLQEMSRTYLPSLELYSDKLQIHSGAMIPGQHKTLTTECEMAVSV